MELATIYLLHARNVMLHTESKPIWIRVAPVLLEKVRTIVVCVWRMRFAPVEFQKWGTNFANDIPIPTQMQIRNDDVEMRIA